MWSLYFGSCQTHTKKNSFRSICHMQSEWRNSSNRKLANAYVCVLVYFASVGVCGCFVNANLCHERTGIYWPFYIFAVGAFSARREIEIGNVACNARVVPKVDRIWTWLESKWTIPESRKRALRLHFAEWHRSKRNWKKRELNRKTKKRKKVAKKIGIADVLLNGVNEEDNDDAIERRARACYMGVVCQSTTRWNTYA